MAKILINQASRASVIHFQHLPLVLFTNPPISYMFIEHIFWLLQQSNLQMVNCEFIYSIQFDSRSRILKSIFPINHNIQLSRSTIPGIPTINNNKIQNFCNLFYQNLGTHLEGRRFVEIHSVFNILSLSRAKDITWLMRKAQSKGIIDEIAQVWAVGFN